MDGLLVSPTVLTALGCGLKAAGFIAFPRFVMKALAAAGRKHLLRSLVRKGLIRRTLRARGPPL